jgi:FMN phosphatase YigB (HAD superfamily)
MGTRLITKLLNKHNLILVDADGVILDWSARFDEWMVGHGHQLQDADAYFIDDRFDVSYDLGRNCVKQFNESAAIGFLDPLRDAQQYVQKLHEEHGYTFHLITSLSRDLYSGLARKSNVRTLFGDTAFSHFVFLDTGAEKDHALSRYQDMGCWWVEDKAENAQAGLKCGLRSVLMHHGYNQDYKNPNIPVVQNWQEFYQLVIDHKEPAHSL